MELKQTYGILCCSCGVPIEPNPTSMCLPCLRAQVNITEGIDTEQTLIHCHQCNRYNVGNDKYVAAELESPQLLGICLKKIRGLQHVRVVDAGFIWTEEHSKRIKVRLLIQAEVQQGAVLQQEHVCTFTIMSTLCVPCQYTHTEHTWSTRVQVRQTVNHKRTFLYLEQIILHNRAKLNISNIKEYPHGLDFYFTSRSDAGRFVDLLHNSVPGRHSESQKLISADLKSNTATIEYSIMFEIAQLCKDDLVYLPQRFYNQLGGLGPLCIVSKVNSRIHFVDPLTGNTGSLTAAQYFEKPFVAFRDRRHKVEGIVLVSEEENSSGARGQEVKVAYVELQRENDMYDGVTVHTKTYLSSLCKPGRSVAVYSLDNIDYQAYGITPSDNYLNLRVVIVGKWKAAKQHTRHRLARYETEEGVAIVNAPDDDINALLEEMYDDDTRDRELDILMNNLEQMNLTQPLTTMNPTTTTQNTLTHMQYTPVSGIQYQGFCPQ